MSTTTESLGVNNTLHHLSELADRMRFAKYGEYGFSEQDISILGNITSSINKLESERSKTHELLETETIHSSILRHRLFMSPDEINNEMQTAVSSARQSNADELKKLQDQLQSLNDSIDYLEKRLKTLEKQNAILHPERDMVRAQHEEVISQLNQRMADKASKQITLNETRDKLRETNQKIVELETGIVILKEDMIQERADARQEKKRLKQAVHDTTKKTKKQKEANIGKKKELDTLKEEVTESEGKLHAIRKSIRRLETTRNRLEQQEKQLEVQLDLEHTENEELRQKGNKIRTEREELEKRYADKKTKLNQRMEMLTKETIQADKDYERLFERQQGLRIDIKEAVEARNYDSSKVKELNDILQQKKDELLFKADDMARMKIENDDMEKQIELLEENHEASMAMLSKQIQDHREALNKERKGRFDLQDRRDAALKELEDFKTALAKYMKQMNQRLADDKQKHSNLSTENAQYNKDILTCDERIKQMEDELKKATRNCIAMEKEYTEVVTGLESGISQMKAQLTEKKQQIEEMTPGYEEREKTFDETTQSYGEMKKCIVKLKNKKNGLADQIRRTKQEIDKISRPQSAHEPPPKVQLTNKLRDQRKSALLKMKKEAKEVKEMEENIYHAGRKLKAVIEENGRFLKSSKKMEEECDNIEKRILFNTAMKEALQLEVVKQRGKLEEGWREDEEMEKEFAERDKLFLDDITDLQKRTDEREQKVSDITDKLQDELFLLASFLENVASRRPPESRHGDRPNTASNAPTVFRDYLDSRRLDKSSKDNLKKVRDELKASVNETLGLVKTDGAGDCQ